MYFTGACSSQCVCVCPTHPFHNFNCRQRYLNFLWSSHLPRDTPFRADVIWSHVRHTSGCVRPAPRRSMAHRCCGSDGDPAAATQCQAMRKWSIACRLEKEGSFFKVVRKCPNVVLALHLDDLEVDIAPQQHQIDRGNGCSLKFCVWEHLTSYSLCAFALEVSAR